jgi:antitoxin PrlF
MMTLFLEFLMKDAISHPDNLIPYTQEMSTELDELLAGVEIDQ